MIYSHQISRQVTVIISILGLVALFVSCSTQQSSSDALEESKENVATENDVVFEIEVDVNKAVEKEIKLAIREVDHHLRKSPLEGEYEVEYTEGTTNFEVEFSDADTAALMTEEVLNSLPDFEVEVIRDTRRRVTIDDGHAESLRESAIEQSILAIQDRLETLDISEVQIVRRAPRDLVVTLVGADDNEVERARSLIVRRGELSFHMVDESSSLRFFLGFSEELPQGFELYKSGTPYLTIRHAKKERLQELFDGEIPAGRVIGYEFHPVYVEDSEILDKENSFWEAYLLFEPSELSAEHLQDARMTISEFNNRPYVEIDFTSEGIEQLAEMTTNNVGHRLALVIDDEVKMAPVIAEPITGGQLLMSLKEMASFMETQQEAHDLATILRNQVLPAPIKIKATSPLPGKGAVDTASTPTP